MRAPDLVGSCGRSWLIPNRADNPASVCQWLVNRPGAHPFWSWWSISVITLADIEGVKPAHKHYPEAEYEFVIYSIDPESCPTPDPESQEGYPPLIPLDVIHQFHGLQMPEVRRLVELMTQTILTGRLSPDQDFRSAWKATLQSTVEHLKQNALS